MKLFVNCFNHVTWAQTTARSSLKFGLTPILVDNGSTYTPMKKWLSSKEFEVILLGGNHGCGSFFRLDHHLKEKEPFLETDGDLDLSDIPDDLVTKLQEALALNEDVMKSGVSLEWTDVPKDYILYDHVESYEGKYWSTPRPGNCFLAQIGNTLAYYDPARFHMMDKGFYSAVRLDRPYTARHLPWYIDVDNLDEETRYYFSNVTGTAYYGSRCKRYLEGT